jgi:hypothetical protein
MPVYVWVLAVAAVVRVTRFVNLDLLFEPVRAAVERRAGADSKLSYLLSCPWCASIWIAAAVMPAAYLSTGAAVSAFEVVASVLAASYVAGTADRYLEP